MRRKSERNKTTSTSSPEKKVTRRGGRRSAAAPEQDEEKVPQTDEERQSGKEEGSETESGDVEVTLPKGRKKLARGTAAASKAGSEDREETPRPSRSRRRTTVQPKYVEVVDEEDEESENGKISDEIISKLTETSKPVTPTKSKTASPSKKRGAMAQATVPVATTTEQIVDEVVKETTPSPQPDQEAAATSKPSEPIVETNAADEAAAVETTENQLVETSTDKQDNIKEATEEKPAKEGGSVSPPPVDQDRKSPEKVEKIEQVLVSSTKSKSVSPERDIVQSRTKKREASPAPADKSTTQDQPASLSPVPKASDEHVQVAEPIVEPIRTSESQKCEILADGKPTDPRPLETAVDEEPKPPNKRTRKCSSSSSSSTSERDSAIRRGNRSNLADIQEPNDSPAQPPQNTEPPPDSSQDVATDDATTIITSNQPTDDKAPQAQEVAEKENQSVVKATAKPIRRRKWITQKSHTDGKPHILAISTDSLKNLISDVRPVPLSDVKLESSPEPEPSGHVSDEDADRRPPDADGPKPKRNARRDRSVDEPAVPKLVVVTAKPIRDPVGPAEDKPARKVLLVGDGTTATTTTMTTTTTAAAVVDAASAKVQRPPSPAKFSASSILYITNLVRPFTVLQLKGLLARTGKLTENGFWIDKIKSKCYVKYETEDEAVETRHALHGVRWPTSNPKCLNVDFGSEAAMDKAIESTLVGIDPNAKAGATTGGREERVAGGWERFEADEKREKPANRPVREWDLGKKEDLGGAGGGRADVDPRERAVRTGAATTGAERDGIDRARDQDRGGRKRSSERLNRGTPSQSPIRKTLKKENEPPLRLLDDLFRKTKSTPCIYWLPLTAEQISVKEEARRQQMAEHRRKIDESILKEKERQREREKERERERERERGRARDRSADRRRDRSKGSRSRDGAADRDRRRN